jgi:hypothetical protein
VNVRISHRCRAFVEMSHIARHTSPGSACPVRASPRGHGTTGPLKPSYRTTARAITSTGTFRAWVAHALQRGWSQAGHARARGSVGSRTHSPQADGACRCISRATFGPISRSAMTGRWGSLLDDEGLNEDRTPRLFLPWLEARHRWPWAQFIDRLAYISNALRSAGGRADRLILDTETHPTLPISGWPGCSG